MGSLKKSQILLEISEDKKVLTIDSGSFQHPVRFASCPAKPLVDISKTIQMAILCAGFAELPGWENEKCGYEGGKCTDCS